MTDVQFKAIMDRLTVIEARLSARTTSSAAHAAAPVVNIDGEYGDPVVKWPTNKWNGPSMDGRKFSECPAEFLLLEADWLEQKGRNPRAGKEQYAPRDLENAAKARAWAARNAANPPAEKPQTGGYGGGGGYGGSGYGASKMPQAPADGPPAVDSAGYGSDDDIPF